MTAEALYFDQYDRSIDDNPYPMMKRLRDEAPVWYNEKYNYYVLSRFDDVLAASRDWETFSSGYGTVQEMMAPDPLADAPLIWQDPPYHDHLRAVVAPWFTPAKIAELEDEFRKIIIGYLEPLEGRAEFDFVEDFGRWVPMDVISSIVGVPEGKDRRSINEWANDSLHREEGQTELGPRQLEAVANVEAYLSQLLKDRQENPQDDLATVIATAIIKEEDGERPLTDGEKLRLVRIVVNAGNETAARLLGSAGWLLAKYPEQRQMLRDDPSRITAAVEELLRLEAPSPVQFRRVMKDVEIHGVQIPKGSDICLLTSSAGRDERQYDNPDVLDINRKARRHVTFGYGVHSCLGNNVARLEVRVALEEVLKRIPDWEVDEAGMKRVRTSTVRGFSHVPVRIIP